MVGRSRKGAPPATLVVDNHLQYVPGLSLQEENNFYF
jgi:hypothetical protein